MIADIASGKIDTVIVYKVDRLTRALSDFAKIVDAFDKQGVSFVSVTQQFNTTTSMGRLTLNVLLSFAQFDREVNSERIRDKVAASKRRACGSGAMCPRVTIESKENSSLIRRKLPLCEVSSSQTNHKPWLTHLQSVGS